MGLLKGCFQSLFEICAQVSGQKQHLWVIMWIRCCLILHNLIIHVESVQVDTEDEWHSEIQAILHDHEQAQNASRATGASGEHTYEDESSGKEGSSAADLH